MGTENTPAPQEENFDDFGQEEELEETKGQEEETGNEDDDIEAVVTGLVDSMVQDENGKWQFPEDKIKGVDKATLFAAKAERRRRDTQASYTKTRQENKKLQTVNEKLESHVLETATMHLSEEQKEELDELKLRDPDKWREKLNEYEEESRNVLKEQLQKFQKEGEKMSELEIRKAKVQAFEQTTGIKLNDKIIAEELPAAYTKQLENGDIDFDQFLEKAQKFLTGQRKIAGADDKPPKPNPDLSKAGGGATPTEEAKAGDIMQSYKNEIY